MTMPMTIKEAMDRVKRLDIRDAESDDYIALYIVIQKLEEIMEGEEE